MGAAALGIIAESALTNTTADENCLKFIRNCLANSYGNSSILPYPLKIRKVFTRFVTRSRACGCGFPFSGAHLSLQVLAAAFQGLNIAQTGYKNGMEKKLRRAHWLWGIDLSLLLFVGWSNSGPTIDIGLMTPDKPDETIAIRELAARIAINPFANKYTIRWQNVYSKGQKIERELRYNRLARSLQYTTYKLPYYPTLTCRGVRDWTIETAASIKMIAWIDVLNHNDCQCDWNDTGPID